MVETLWLVKTRIWNDGMDRGVMLIASVFHVMESSARVIWNKGGTAHSRPFSGTTFFIFY